jgi:hypothetical protein
MINKKKFFIEYIYNLYPKEISSLWDNKKYISQPEYKRLLNLIFSRQIFPETKKENLINLLQTNVNLKFNDFSLFTWNDRAYNLQSLIKSNGLTSIVLCINISVIIPYYTIYILRTERENKKEIKRKHPPILNNSLLEKYDDLVSHIELLLENQFSLKKFPNELKDEVIAHIGFQDIEIGKFTFFNAFFLDRYTHTKIF